MTLGLGPARSSGSRSTSGSSCGRTRWRAAIAADRAAGRRPIAIVATIGTTSSTSVDPIAAIADIAEREGLWLHVDCRLRRSRRDAPGATGAVRRLGARRFDRRQPAQVAVHAARRLAAADPPDGRPAGRLQPRPGVPAHARPGRRRSTTTTSTPPSSVVGSARSSSGSSCAGSGSRVCVAGSPAPGDGRGLRRLGRGGPRLGAAGARPVLDGLLPLAPARWSRPTRRSTRRTPRSWTPSIGPARSSCRTPGSPVGSRSGSRSATCGPSRATSSGPGRCSARPRRRERAVADPTPHDVRFFATPEELRDWFDANHATADELWLGYYKKASGRPSVEWSQVVDEALCVGWIDGVR